MKNWMVLGWAVISVAVFGNKAHAFVGHPYLECMEPSAGQEGGFVVTIEHAFHTMEFPNRIPAREIAKVTWESRHEQVDVGYFNVERRASTRPGAPVIFNGSKFRLDVNFTVTPVSGRSAGRLRFQTREGERYVADVLCASYR